MERILITGCAGLVGRELLNILNKSSDKQVFGVDNLLYETDFLYPCQFQRGNVGDKNFMQMILKNFAPTHVIHLAGIVGDAACSSRPKEAYEANVTSLEILRDNFDGRIIWMSSCSVYGANDNLVNEESTFNPLSLYAEMKVQGEDILKDKNALILRLGTLHGVSGRFRNDLIVNVLAIRALIEKKLSIYGGTQYRPLLSVHDLANWIVSDFLKRDIIGTFNLLENNFRIKDVAQIVKSVLPETIIETTEMPFEDRRNYKVSFEKAKKTFGLVRTYSVRDTVKEIQKMYLEGRIKDYSNIKYSNMSALQIGNK